MADPLMSLYPRWILSAQESIQFIQSGKRREAEIKAHIQQATLSDDARDIAYYQKQIRKWELAMKGEWA